MGWSNWNWPNCHYSNNTDYTKDYDYDLDCHRNVISGIAHYTAHVIVQEQPVFYGKVLPQNGGYNRHISAGHFEGVLAAPLNIIFHICFNRVMHLLTMYIYAFTETQGRFALLQTRINWTYWLLRKNIMVFLKDEMFILEVAVRFVWLMTKSLDSNILRKQEW